MIKAPISATLLPTSERFVPQLYEAGYCARGAMELRIKEHKTYLQSEAYVLLGFRCQPVPAFSAFGCLRVAAYLADRSIAYYTICYLYF